MTADPHVSVVIPAYNAQASIAAAVHSALAQTEAHIEVLVIDDGSTDGTAEIVRALAAADHRVRLLAAARNGGPAAARNIGLRAAAGAWVALLDADDSWHPSRLSTLLQLAQAQEADMVCDNLLLEEPGTAPAEAMIPPAMLPQPALLSAAAFVSGNIGDRRTPRISYGFLKPMFRRAFLEGRGLAYDARNRFGEDFLLYLKCLLHGAVWWITPEPLYRYTVRPGSLTEVQSAADLDRIRRAEAAALADPLVRADRALAAALRRHKRRIDRGYCYRAFTDALKARAWPGAAGVLLASPGAAGHIACESLVQAPAILRKALRGGYRRARSAAA